MAQDNAIVANLAAMTVNWASPVSVDETKNADRQVDILLQSSEGSWTRSNTDIQPNLDLYPELGFPVEGDGEAYPLAVAVQGSFESFFKDKAIPTSEEDPEGGDPAAGTITESPESARLVIVGSHEFVDDTVFEISANMTRDRYLGSLQFMQNAVDWSVEDTDLLAIRSRGTVSRILNPEAEEQQSFWEGLNYTIALLALVGIGIVWNVQRRNEQPVELIPPDGIGPEAVEEEEA